MYINTHYGPGLCPNRGREFAMDLARMLEDFIGFTCANGGAVHPVLLFRGMSGTTLATRVSDSLAVKHDMVYVRKPEERSHGSHTERAETFTDLPKLYVFVDDFIGSGNTLKQTIKHVMRGRSGPLLSLTANGGAATIRLYDVVNGDILRMHDYAEHAGVRKRWPRGWSGYDAYVEPEAKPLEDEAVLLRRSGLPIWTPSKPAPMRDLVPPDWRKFEKGYMPLIGPRQPSYILPGAVADA